MIGRRIKRMRKMRGMSQRELGLAAGFNPANADVRITQYETDARTPKEDISYSIASALKVSAAVIGQYDVATGKGLLCTLYELEELYGLSIIEHNDRIYFGFINQTAADKAIAKWHKKRSALFRGKLSRDEYNDWKYRKSLNDLE